MNGFMDYEPNTKGRDFVCGDIHGCYRMLDEQLEKINFNPTIDRMFCVGDLADRGPQSPECLEYAKKLWFFPVLGNHEDMFLQCWIDKTASPYWHYQNGGEWVSGMSEGDRQEYAEIIRGLPLAIKVGEFLILHSLAPKLETVDQLRKGIAQYREYILWERDPLYNHRIRGVDMVYAGHTIGKEIQHFGNVIDIDTGSFILNWERKGHGLTVVELIHH